MSRAHRGPNAGLRNVGHSCYMNCILQCLTVAKFYEESQLCDAAPQSELLQGLLYAMSRLHDGGLAYDPIKLKTCIAKHSEKFGSKTQQDSHEFLIFLLNAVETALNETKKPDETNRIKDLFEIKLKNTTTYVGCGHKAFTVENYLTVSIPTQIDLKDREQPRTLEECLKWYTQLEKLNDEDKLRCATCSPPKLANCSLQYSFERVPPFLIIHLKKFDFYRHVKLEIDVQYPFDGLVISTSSIENGSVNETTYIYDLLAVCYHIGTLQGGVYEADVRQAVDQDWFHYNDSDVSKTNEREMRARSTNAYILFYKIDEVAFN